MKLKLDLSDPEVRSIWETVLEARKRVANWPAWKRGEDMVDQNIPPKALEYAKEVVERIKNAPPLPDLSEEERTQKGHELFEYEGTKFKRFQLFRPFVWASDLAGVGPGSDDYMRVGYIDEKGRRCHRPMHKQDFRALFVEASVHQMDYKAAWQELYAEVFEAAWQPRDVNFLADYLLDMLIEIGAKHGGPTMDALANGTATAEVHAKHKDLHVGSPVE